jgi:hypothetical protein
MRLWLKDSERRPDPAPLPTDDRKVVLVGLVAWLVALAAMIVAIGPLLESGLGWWLWTAVAGLGLGLVLLVYVVRRRS